MFFEFPFEYARIPRLGLLFYPVVRLELRTKAGWQPFEFLVDTGADMTTLPKKNVAFVGHPVLNITNESDSRGWWDRSQNMGISAAGAAWEYRIFHSW